MPFKFAKRFLPVFTMAAVLSINGQVSFNYKTVQATLAFELKITFTPTRNNTQVVPPKRINFVLPFNYSPTLAAKHAHGTFTPAHIDRLRTIMRNRRILFADTPRTT
ncbi:hypothetical protein K466DRAFT_603747 [Polyporus arcularius HHB13444]|uniref:Uncharacterized protein n=1 Tax=Polyporus arcularius HHB13444 TaxID=1314778 RepID=A0A5C3P0L1_9APHY|nr:hypothetical protein K466DRAFT_603747 [Polyporus arcularius HHB13444]